MMKALRRRRTMRILLGRLWLRTKLQQTPGKTSSRLEILQFEEKI
jgi:hypothetical protein